MRPDEHPEIDLHFDATEEVIAQAKRIGPVHSIIEKLAQVIACNDASREEEFVYREHVVVAANRISQALS